MTDRLTWQDRLVEMGACAEAIKYARKYSGDASGFRQAWKDIKDKDGQNLWMTWLLMRTVDAYGVMPAATVRRAYPASRVYAALTGTPEVVEEGADVDDSPGGEVVQDGT